jgi:hypothetical protein
LIAWVDRLRREVIPSGRWKRPEPELYARTKRVLRGAGEEDPAVLAEE